MKILVLKAREKKGIEERREKEREGERERMDEFHKRSDWNSRRKKKFNFRKARKLDINKSTLNCLSTDTLASAAMVNKLATGQVEIRTAAVICQSIAKKPAQ